MCPLYPLHIVVLYFCLLLPLLLAVVQGAESLAGWRLNFSVPRLGDGESLREETSTTFDLVCLDCPKLGDWGQLSLELKNEDPRIALLSHPQSGAIQDEAGLLQVSLASYPADFTVTFNLTATFLGFTSVAARVVANTTTTTSQPPKDQEPAAAAAALATAEQDLKVTVTRSAAKKLASKIFGYSVAALISLAYINMGCALDLEVLKAVVKRPIGPAIGFVAQFIFMPLISFGLGFIFPGSDPEMRLGLFVTGCSPGGGASNIWTVMFGGNLDLSVTMTFISTVAAFFMMPAWMFCLGESIIADTELVVPYSKILTYGIMLVVPLSIGMGITRCLPRLAKFLVKCMKPLAFFLIIFILVCGIWSQFFMIRLISWRVAVVGLALPWLGFAFGCLFSKLCRRERKDIIAIAIETGIQNTGMSIFMLWFTLDHPAGDLAAVVPVAVATLTPFPLLAALVFYRLKAHFCPHEVKEVEMADMMDKKAMGDRDETMQSFLDKNQDGKLTKNGDANDNKIVA